MFVQTEITPNPNSLKFLPGKKVSNDVPTEIIDKNESNNELIRNILSINGVTGIFLLEDFLSVNKDEKTEWEDLKHIIISFINDYYSNGNEIVINKEKKSSSDLSRINLTDKKDEIVNKIKKAKTDNLALPSDDKKLNERPEVENLLGIYSSLNNQTLSDTINEFGGKNFSEFKQKLSDVVVEKISQISDEINKLKKDNNFIDKILEEGAVKADKITSKKVKEMKEIIGF